MPVVIAGMHRSGTSMVTRLLNLSGLYLGKEEDLLAHTKDNPEGFWENAKFQKINDAILTSFGGGWDLPPLLEVNWERSPHLTALSHEARQAIAEISQQPVWGWKDPRNSLTFPFWKRLIPDSKIVICLRNPFEVYHSLSRRGAASSSFSYNLWLRYNEQLIKSTKPEERIITHYDSFFRDPKSELRRLVNFLELDVSDRTIHTACQTISTSLRHNQGSVNDLYATDIPDKLLDLYRELCLIAGDVYGISLSLEEEEFLQNITPSHEFVISSSESGLEKISQDLKIANNERSRLQKKIEKLREETTALQSAMDSILVSRSWRLIQIVQKIRVFFIPVGSKREKSIKTLFKKNKL
jgi:hypothetical protein